MAEYTVTLPSGVEWTPRFIAAIDQTESCGNNCAKRLISYASKVL